MKISGPAPPNPLNFDPGVRSKFQIVQGRTYTHSYYVCKFQDSSANSVGGDSGKDGRTEGRTDGGDKHNIHTLFKKRGDRNGPLKRVLYKSCFNQSESS